MPYDTPRSTARIAGHPIHPMLIPFPIVCFVGTLVCDIAYANTALMMWSDFSSWLISAGVILAVLAIIAGLIDFLGDGRIRGLGAAWIHVIGNLIVFILAVFDAFVHTHDAWTSVVPTGLILSALIVLVLIVTGWNGWAMVYRHGVALKLEDRR